MLRSRCQALKARHLPSSSSKSSSTRRRIPKHISTRSLTSSASSCYPRNSNDDAPRASTRPSPPAPESSKSVDSSKSTAKDLKAQYDNYTSLFASTIPPEPNDQPLSNRLIPLQQYLQTALFDANQPNSSLNKSSTPSPQIHGLPPGFPIPHAISHVQPVTSSQSPKEAVITLVSPFEGGRHYTIDSLKEVAATLDAEILRLDLVLALGTGGSQAGSKGTLPISPRLPDSANPLRQNRHSNSTGAPTPVIGASEDPTEDSLEDIDDEPQSQGASAIVVTPMFARATGDSGPGSSSTKSPVLDGVKDDWVKYFRAVLSNLETRKSPENFQHKPHIILLEAAESMAASFPIWWLSFVEAVRRHRRGDQPPSKAHARILQPTAIVLSVTPSLLPPYTVQPTSPLTEEESQDPRERLMQSLAEKFGGAIHARTAHEDAPPLWWGTEEADFEGRERQLEERLAAIAEKDGALTVMHTPSVKNSRPSSGNFPNPFSFIEMLSGQQGRAQAGSSHSLESFTWKALPILPDRRDRRKEIVERLSTRLAITVAMLSRATARNGKEFSDPDTALESAAVEILNDKTDSGRTFSVSQERRVAKTADSPAVRDSYLGWQCTIPSWSQIPPLVARALGAKMQLNTSGSRLALTWQDIIATMEAEKAHEDLIRAQANAFKTASGGKVVPQARRQPPNNSKKDAATSGEESASSIIAAVKKAPDLNQYERRLLNCIVEAKQITSGTFDNIHLPLQTIDTIRSLISLPLLFPDAFRQGILKDHSTSGALLFGPPGTGKTLLARAVANESGARMIAIQPSDVNDKYVGEGEKLVKAVFTLARRLSPCVVFIDEAEAVFGSRIGRDASSGGRVHDQLLTEFMQEMDGLSSSDANNTQRVVVIGATNRPFDLDEAVLRRLPRRILVDLPDVNGRKAILKILLRDEKLADDVDLDKVARETDGFSGSDLKHLCISAALASVKESVSVPWLSSQSASSTPTTDVPLPPTPSGGPQQPIPQQHVQAVPTTNTLAGMKNRVASHAQPRSPFREYSSTARTPSTSQSVDETQEDDEGIQDDIESTSDSDPSVEIKGEEQATITSDEAADDSPPSPAKEIRQLKMSHFKTALAEIRPSSSEEGTLPELRKWAEQFGEGGSRRGAKKGFGKGFGFNNQQSKSNEERKYGSVNQD